MEQRACFLTPRKVAKPNSWNFSDSRVDDERLANITYALILHPVGQSIHPLSPRPCSKISQPPFFR